MLSLNLYDSVLITVHPSQKIQSKHHSLHVQIEKEWHFVSMVKPGMDVRQGLSIQCEQAQV